MIQITMTVGPGAQIARQGLERLRRQVPVIGRQRIYATGLRIIKRLQKYPPPPAGSRYERTFTLRRKWRLIRVGDRGYRVTNTAYRRGRYYSKWVVGNARGQMQAAIHQGRWPLFAQVTEAEIARMPRACDEHLQRVTRGLGL